MSTNPIAYESSTVEQCKQDNFRFNSRTQKILLGDKQIKNDWKDKCERSLYLAKHLGNIYTGSLYNGLITLICDPTIDLSHKKVMLFSYGSGCAASMFFVHCKPGYAHNLRTTL